MRLMRFGLTSLLLLFGTGSALAADLVWEVENPFRLFKTPQAFALHEAAFKAVRGDITKPLPADIIWRTERRLNDPDCKDRSSPDACGATAGPRFEQSRLGWAAQTITSVCYETGGNPRRYPGTCDRKYSWGTAKEDYILPEAHTVQIGLSPERLVEAGEGDCQWQWQPHTATGKSETRKLKCKSKLTIARVPYSTDRAKSGVAVTVKLPNGTELSDAEVIVDDVFMVALGDSFASGESNPDRPVTFSPVRETLYDPQMMREEFAARKDKRAPVYKVAFRRGRINPEGAAAPAAGRRGEAALFQGRLARVSRELRAAPGALVQRRLPPLAIRLSVPRRHRADAGEPPSRGDARVARLLGRRGRRRPVPRTAVARGRGWDGASAVRPAQRVDLPGRRGRVVAQRLSTSFRPISSARPASR